LNDTNVNLLNSGQSLDTYLMAIIEHQ